MESTGDNLMINRDEITDATLATFADATVVPDRYLRSDEVRGVVVIDGGGDDDYALPVVDMARLLDPEFSQEEIAKLGSACRDWGFFQLTNHGADESIMTQMKENTVQFFSLPLEKKKTAAVPTNSGEGFGHHFSRSSGDKLDWAESLILNTQYLGDRNMDLWPTHPSTFRDVLEKYAVEMANLASRLMAFMAGDLGIKEETLVETMEGKEQSVAFHYYPPCRHRKKVLGITPHTDGLGLALLLHVNGTPGLQVKKDGRWFPVKPLPDAFVVNIGDILEVLTNGRYKSVEHRVLPDADRGRLTVVVFQHACVAGVVKPLPELGEARYKSMEKVEYIKGNFMALIEGAKFLESLKI